MSLLLSAAAPGRGLLCAGMLSAFALLAGCAGSSRNGPLAYDSDTAIAERVHQAMAADALTATALQNGRIRIRVLQGSVTLLGDADNVTQMADALAAVRSVGGVRSVQSDLHVRATTVPGAALERGTRAATSESAKTDFPTTSRTE